MAHPVNRSNIQPPVSRTETATTPGNRLTALAHTVSSFTTKIFSSIGGFLRAHSYITATAGVAMAVGAAVAINKHAIVINALSSAGTQLSDLATAAGTRLGIVAPVETYGLHTLTSGARYGFNVVVEAATPILTSAANAASSGVHAFVDATKSRYPDLIPSSARLLPSL